MRARAGLVLMFATTTLVTSSCADFDSPRELLDFRVLAMKTEPAEIMYSAAYALTDPEERPDFLQLPTTTVDVEIFAFDPSGGRVGGTINLCPQEADAACRLYDLETKSEFALDDDDRAELDAAYLPRDIDPIRIGRLDDDPTGRVRGLQFTYDFTEPVIDSVIRNSNNNPRLTPFSILPRFTTTLTNLERIDTLRDDPKLWSERAYKRLPFTLDLQDPALPDEYAQALFDVFGLERCPSPLDPDTFEEGLSDCFYPRPANQNPRIIGFELIEPPPDDALERYETRVETLFADESTLGRFPVLGVDPGRVLNLRPVFAPGSQERYQIFSYDIDAGTLVIKNRLEDLACNWHATAGGHASLTSVENDFTLDVEWRLPRGAEPGTRDALVLVVRDQRGGVDVAQVTVEYRDPDGTDAGPTSDDDDEDAE